MGGALQDQKSRKGVEGVCPAHSGRGSLLSSQASPLPSKSPSRPSGSWGHRREAGVIRRGRREGTFRTGGAGEEQSVFALPTKTQEACWAPR